MRKIKVVEIRTTYYVPDFEEDYYQEHSVKTLEEALAVDLADLKDGSVEMSNLGTELPEIEYHLSIVEVPDDESANIA